jgi:hypothetical protein
VLHIKQAGERGGAVSIRIDDPNSDVEFVETDQDPNDSAKGKYEIAVQSDKFQINGRKTNDKDFEPIAVFQREAVGGNIGLRTKSQLGGGEGVIEIANAKVSPSVNSAEGGVLFVKDRALKYRGSNGTVTEIAPA